MLVVWFCCLQAEPGLLFPCVSNPFAKLSKPAEGCRLPLNEHGDGKLFITKCKTIPLKNKNVKILFIQSVNMCSISLSIHMLHSYILSLPWVTLLSAFIICCLMCFVSKAHWDTILLNYYFGPYRWHAVKNNNRH